MKKLTLLITVLLLSQLLTAQNANFEEGMKKGFDAFNDGELHKDWIGAAESLVDLAKKHTDQWLPYYWASYMYTQIARASYKDPPEGITVSGMLDLSQKNLDLASKRIKDKTLEQQADFHVLQGLIYSFRPSPEGEKDKFTKLKAAETKAAIRKAPDSPLVMVDLGLDLLFRDDFQSVYAGRVLLLKAREKFNSRMKPRYMSTHYSEQWVDYWEPQSRKGIMKLTAAE